MCSFSFFPSPSSLLPPSFFFPLDILPQCFRSLWFSLPCLCLCFSALFLSISSLISLAASLQSPQSLKAPCLLMTFCLQAPAFSSYLIHSWMWEEISAGQNIPLGSGGGSCPARPVQGGEGLRQEDRPWGSGLAAIQEDLACQTPEQTFRLLQCVALHFS